MVRSFERRKAAYQAFVEKQGWRPGGLARERRRLSKVSAGDYLPGIAVRRA
jgi:hypothetical protein